jgi:hypothetical protein
MATVAEKLSVHVLCAIQSLLASQPLPPTHQLKKKGPHFWNTGGSLPAILLALIFYLLLGLVRQWGAG